ncbi:MAG: hypothetical protein AB1736_09455 [Chloroflexota bacterium]
MSRRDAWLSATLVFLAAVAVRTWAATIITFPRPEDTAYYVGVARHLVEGRGLVSDAIWSYGTPPLEFPRPAFEVWLPLPSFLAALSMLAFGPSFAAAQVPSIVIGGLVAVLAWKLAADVAVERRLPAGRARTLALGTGLSAAVFLPLVLHSVLPDSTMLFGALALATCLLGARILSSPLEAPAGGWGLRARLGLDDRRVVALGTLLGLAALTRNEAIWLALAWALVAWFAGGPAGPASLDRRRRIGLVVGAAIPAIAVFLPWAVRDWLAFGSPFPGQALANALSLDGRDIFAWSETPTLGRYLDAGLGTLVGLRVTGFVHNLVNVLLLLGIPISAIGLAALPWTATDRVFRWRLPALSLPRRSSSTLEPGRPAPPAVIVRAEPPRPASTAPPPRPPSIQEWPAVDLPEGRPGGLSGARQADRPPAWMVRPTRLEPLVPTRTPPGAFVILLAFSGLTFAATTLLFPIATTWGTFLHASAAIQVLLVLSALLALDRLIAEVGRRRAWTRPVAWLGPMLGIAAGALFTVALLPGFGRDGEGTRARFEALPAALAAAGVPIEVRGAPVITDSPIYLAEVTGANALALPDEPPDSVVDLAARFPGTRLLIVAEDNEGIWPEAALSTAQGLACFESVDVELEGLVVYRILCP